MLALFSACVLTVCAASHVVWAEGDSAASGPATASAAAGNDGPAYGPELQGFDYPAPVEQYDFTSQGVALHMAYMDIKPVHPNGRTAVLLHGKNFCAATWEPTIQRLSDAGYRVIAPRTRSASASPASPSTISTVSSNWRAIRMRCSTR